MPEKILLVDLRRDIEFTRYAVEDLPQLTVLLEKNADFEYCRIERIPRGDLSSTGAEPLVRARKMQKG